MASSGIEKAATLLDEIEERLMVVRRLVLIYSELQDKEFASSLMMCGSAVQVITGRLQAMKEELERG